MNASEFWDRENGPPSNPGQISIKRMACEFAESYLTECARSKRGNGHPMIEDVIAYCAERKNGVDPQQWFNHYVSNGWRVGRNPMKDWKAAVRTWEKNDYGNGNGKASNARTESRPSPARQRAEHNASVLYEALRNHVGERVVSDGGQREDGNGPAHESGVIEGVCKPIP